MTTDLAARLAEIKDRHLPGDALTLAQLIHDAKTTHPHASGEVIVRGCVVSDAARLREAVRQVWLKDMPALVTFAEKALGVADDLDEQAASLRRRGTPADAPLNFAADRSDRAAGLVHAADEIRMALFAALADTTEEASRA